MKVVKGKNKMPEAFRNSQNWIGGATWKDTKFTPPLPSLVPELMSDLEKILNNTDVHEPHLIRMISGLQLKNSPSLKSPSLKSTVSFRLGLFQTQTEFRLGLNSVSLIILVATIV